MRKLMFEERETGPCSSSTFEAEDIELDGLARGTFCVWNPRSSSSSSNSPGRTGKKSSSTGSSSKWWKLRHLLPRSHIDGKEPLVFLTPSKSNDRVAHEVSKPSSGDCNASISMEKEAQYTNRAIATAKEGDLSEKKSLLPYRQEFIGNVNGAAHIPLYLYPFLNTTSKSRLFEYLRCTSGVIRALVKEG